MRTNRHHVRRTLLRTFAFCTPFLRDRAKRIEDSGLRILLIRPDHIGDLLFTTPALRVLRKAFPDAYLACMVGPWAKAVVEKSPHIDELIVCTFPGFTRQPKNSVFIPYQMAWKWAMALRARRFNMAVVLRFDHWWGALLAYLAGIPHRLGYAIAECEPFLTMAVPYVSRRHEVKQNLTLVEQVILAYGRDIPQDPLHLEFVVTRQDQEDITHYLAERGVTPDEKIVAIHPGAGAAVKEWRTDAFAQVADAIVERWQAKVVLTGSHDDLDLAWSIYAQMCNDPIVAAGNTTLGQLAALYQRSRLVIGPDCGPLHLAVAMGTPTVHLYGPVDVGKFGPWGSPARHLVLTSGYKCIPCNRLDYSAKELPNHPCVRAIAPQMVLEAVQKLLVKE